MEDLLYSMVSERMCRAVKCDLRAVTFLHWPSFEIQVLL
jgi:hypothetical protein